MTLGAAVGVAVQQLAPASPYVRGLKVDERELPSGRSAQAWLDHRAVEARSRNVRLVHDEDVHEAALGELGVTIDVDATLEKARRIGHEGSVIRRVRESVLARRGRMNIPLVWRVDEVEARRRLETLAASIERKPVDARLDMESRTKFADVPGLRVDVEATLAELCCGEHHDEETVRLVTWRVAAATTLDDLVRVDVEKVVATFETTFSIHGSGRGRAVNIATAAARIDGVVLQPGQAFSFNELVGERTRANGFTWAPEIQGDELQTGIGGGTCQVSSTLYAAALHGAMDIVERQSHSRPSSYIKMGLDATVSYPSVDFRMRNTLPYPVMIHAYLPRPTAVRVEILGGDPVATVEYRYGIGATEEFVRRVRVMSHFPPGKRIRHQRGSRGFDVTSIVERRFRDGRVDRQTYFSGYRPAPEVYYVSPDYDEAELPPLPEHAAGLEGRETSSAARSERDAYSL